MGNVVSTEVASTPSPNPEAIRIVRKFVKRLRKKDIDFERIILYGSQARGDFGPESDIDVLVVVPKRTRPVRLAILEESAEIELEDVVVVSPLICESESFHSPMAQVDHFFINVREEGVVIQ